jgi:hypothetical protein
MFFTLIYLNLPGLNCSVSTSDWLPDVFGRESGKNPSVVNDEENSKDFK